MGEKHAIARVERLGRIAEAEGLASTQRKEASETGSLLVRGALGAGPTPTGATTGATPSGTPGLITPPTGTTPPAGTTTTQDASGLLQEKEMVGPGSWGIFGAEKRKILDPEKYAEFIKGTAEFRIADALTRDTEALVTRSGPLWDELLNLTQLPIIEGAGALARENAEALRRDMAKGGSARRSAFATIQQMRARESANSEKVQQLSAARKNLIEYGHNMASNNMKIISEWSSNLPFQKNYNDMMDSASRLMLESAMPIMQVQTDKVNAMKQQMRNQKSSTLGRILTGIAGAAMTAAGVMTMNPALIAGGVGMVAGAITGPPSQVGYIGLMGGPSGQVQQPSQFGGGGGGGGGSSSVFDNFTGKEIADLKTGLGKMGSSGQGLINKLFGTSFGQGDLSGIPGPLSKSSQSGVSNASLLWDKPNLSSKLGMK